MSDCNNDANLNGRPQQCSQNNPYGMSAPRFYPPLSKGFYGSTMARSKTVGGSNHLSDLSTHTSIPDYFNWLDEKSRNSIGLGGKLKKHFGLAINQGECGACWAVATATSLGHRYAIALARKGHTINDSLILSALQLLSANDCDSGNLKSILGWELATTGKSGDLPNSSADASDPNYHC